MAGSIQWRAYESDGGTMYGVRIDKSNANAVAFPIAIAETAPVSQLPRGLHMRYCVCQCDANSNITRKIYVGSQEAWIPIAAGTRKIISLEKYPGSPPEPFTILYHRGEKGKAPMPSYPETGLTT